MAGRRWTSLKPVLQSVLLILLLVALMTQLGLLNRVVGYQAAWIAQNLTDEWDNTWMGVPVMQYPGDLMLYQQIMYEVKPDVIVETGTAYGGLTLFLAEVIEHINPDARVLSVDIDPTHWTATAARMREEGRSDLLERIRFLDGSSTAPEIVGAVRDEIARLPGARVLVILDSLHSADHVFDELELYGPMVDVGGYIIVNDTHFGSAIPQKRSDQPRRGLWRWLEGNESFEVDTARDRFMMSCAPGGFVKRVR